jgi:hypothetical protein
MFPAEIGMIMTQRFLGVANPNGAGRIGDSAKPFGFATTKKVAAELCQLRQGAF